MTGKAIKVKIFPWSEWLIINSGGVVFDVGDYAITKTDQGLEAVYVNNISQNDVFDEGENEAKVVRKATHEDLKKIQEFKEKTLEAEVFCKEKIKKYNLPMKLIDTHFSFDGGRITFSFVADGRVDFRDLVKDLTRHFQKSIRLQQVGMRDEARREGGLGPCGRGLCCVGHLQKLGNVTTELARDQQIAHRGSDRLSGICGRLMCCLAYEEDYYKEMARKFPPLESEIKLKKGKGKVISWNILKETYKIKSEDGTVIERSINKNK